MKQLVLLALCCLLLSSPAAAWAATPIRVLPDCTVTDVASGDTLTALCDGRKVLVSLYGIDAPEVERRSRKTGRLLRPGQPFGEEAKTVLEQKVAGNPVQLEVMTVDRGKRLVALVKVGEHLINREMIAEGWAWAYRHYLHGQYNVDFIVAEKAARAARNGLWQQHSPQAPWEFRKENW